MIALSRLNISLFDDIGNVKTAPQILFDLAESWSKLPQVECEDDE